MAKKWRGVRWAFFAALVDGLRVTWPILSGILLFKVCIGAVIGWLEAWSVWQRIYFAFIIVAVGNRVTPVPPHRSRRAAFPHRALAAGQTRSKVGA
jgi:hypothetical protein